MIAVCVLGMSHPKIIEQDMALVLCVLLVVVGIALLLDAGNVRLLRFVPPVWMFLAFCLLSTAWSLDPHQTLRFTAFYALIALIASVLAAAVTPRLLVRGVSLGGVLIILLSVGAVVQGHELALGLAPGGEHLVLQGLYGNRNIMSYVLIVGLCAALADRHRTRAGFLGKLVLVAVYVSLFRWTDSATSLVVAAMVIAGAVFVWFAALIPANRRRTTLRWVLVLAGGVTVLVLFNLTRLFALLGRDSTLSGRSPLWGAIVDEWSARPLHGYGWGGVWTYAWFPADFSTVGSAINDAIGFPLNHGHNAVLDVLIQVGLVGVALYLLIVALALAVGARAVRHSEPVAATWIFLTVGALLVAGVTEPLFAVPLGWFMFVLLASASSGGTARPDESRPRARSRASARRAAVRPRARATIR